MSAKRSAGFTLIEILIVVVIMAVLAATIIPQFSSSTNDAKTSTLQFNLHTLRSQIELYKLNHSGAVPAITNGSLPQLTSSTDVNGTIGAAGTNFPFGPYIMGNMPTNPFDGHNAVADTGGVFPPTATTTDGGWLYNATTGQIAPNTTGHLND
jgi:prepilin-type N-terminal cleavage/methylation domain-containing protein